ncbi:MAG: fluoride efflux transporter CrcB [Neomegalonema sp.]|nr:fluoride efflux transporter CrcB [Neomegalonema sp.]
MNILFVAIGGACGAVLRYLSVGLAARWLGVGFPYGTLFVNVAGSLLMGLLAAWLLPKGTTQTGLLLMTGMMGGFTTFSAFSLDVIVLVERARWEAALLYIGASVLLAVLALTIGLMLGRALGFEQIGS